MRPGWARIARWLRPFVLGDGPTARRCQSQRRAPATQLARRRAVALARSPPIAGCLVLSAQLAAQHQWRGDDADNVAGGLLPPSRCRPCRPLPKPLPKPRPNGSTRTAQTCPACCWGGMGHCTRLCSTCGRGRQWALLAPAGWAKRNWGRPLPRSLGARSGSPCARRSTTN